MTRRELLLSSLALPALASAEEYALGPDSQRHADTPRGELKRYTWISKIYPGAVQDYWVYIPAQYTADTPACLMVFQDGGGFVTEDGGWRVPIVLDNLIHRRELPVMIGLFIDPGVVPAASGNAQARFNRSYEFDNITGRYVTFLLDEILPEVRKVAKISDDPNDRAIGGASSGAIAAFTAAWRRPDAFRRVFSAIGSYTNLRGGEVYPSWIRKSEGLPLRVFLQDGANDLNIYPGSWYLANQEMASALAYAGYDYKIVIGTEGHNSKQGGAILPDALRWLWRDYPAPIAQPRNEKAERRFVDLILDPGSDWQDAGKGPVNSSLRAMRADGAAFLVDPKRPGIVFENHRTHRSVLQTAEVIPGSVQLSADQTYLLVADARTRWVWSFRAAEDGSLAEGEPYFELETSRNQLGTGATGMAMDDEGYLWVATELGIQVCDQPGRVTAIIRNPDLSLVNAIELGGPARQTLFALTTEGKRFSRHVRRTGVPAKAIQPSKPQL